MMNPYKQASVHYVLCDVSNQNGTGSFGATVGRVVNRIAKSRFVLDGKAYRLFRNDGNNSIHGGHRGFGKVIWTVKEYVRDGDTPYITFFYHSFDGEQGKTVGDMDVCERRPHVQSSILFSCTSVDLSS